MTQPDDDWQILEPAPDPARTAGPIRVFGVLNLVIGLLGLICVPGNLRTVLTVYQAGVNLHRDILHEDAVYRAVTCTGLALDIAAAGVLAAAGVGLLRRKAWGRTLSIGYAVYSLAGFVATLVLDAVYLLGPLLRAFSDRAGGPPSLGAWNAAIGLAIWCGFTPIYPGLLLIVMNRPAVARALRPAAIDDAFAR